MTSIGAHRQKRGQATLVAVAAAAVLAMGAGVAAAAGAHASVKAAPAHVAVHTVAKAATGGVEAATGQRLTAGDDTLWLTPKGLYILAPKSSGTDKPDMLAVMDVRQGKVAAEARGDASGTLWAGIYRGPVTDNTKVTITLGSRTLEAKVVTLGGNPGWGAFYVFDAGHQDGKSKPVFTVHG